jgi:hypothetical protein
MDKRQLMHQLLDKLIDEASQEFGATGWDVDLQLHFFNAIEDPNVDAECHTNYRAEVVEDVAGNAHFEEAARVETIYHNGVVYHRDYDNLDITI